MTNRRRMTTAIQQALASRDYCHIFIPSSTRYLEWVVPGLPRGGLTSPPILDPLEAMILDPWDPLVMWNDDDDGDDRIKHYAAGL